LPTYEKTIDPLDAAKIYALLTVFRLILGPCQFLMFSINQVSQVIASMNRIQDLMMIPDIVKKVTDDPSLERGTIQIEEGIFGWNSEELDRKLAKKAPAPKNLQDESETGVLFDINIKFKPKSLNAVIGKIGSGKSS